MLGRYGMPAILAADALRNLLAVGQRSLLALIGIVIGTGSVIAMVNVGENASAESAREFASMGTDLIIAGGGGPLGIAAAELERLPRLMPELSVVAPVATAGKKVGQGKGVQTTLVGATAALADGARLRVSEGRFLTEFDRAETFAVVGRRTAAGARPPVGVGSPLRIDGYVFTVIGILDDLTPNPLLPFDVNDVVMVPLGTLRRVGADPAPSFVVARAAAGRDAIAAGEAMAARLAGLRHGRPVQVQSARQLIEGMRKQAQVFTGLLAAIGAISLVVGGVGVMNVMLMNVSERRREIGLRMAVGARRGHIRIMFLCEAAALSLAGGVAGTALGLLAAYGIAWYSGWQFLLAAGALPLGGGISLAIGLFFGAYPAAAAANLDPIDSLRSA